MKNLKLINPKNVSDEEAASFDTREAGRAVVIDNENKIALLHVTAKNYYKLPGGGIEPGEDKITATKRECLEEIGCQIEIIKEVGYIVEYRKLPKPRNLKQTSYCYIAKVIGQKEYPTFTKHEIDTGFKIVWLPYEKALEALTEVEAIGNQGRDYIVPRDRAFLKEAGILLKDLL